MSRDSLRAALDTLFTDADEFAGAGRTIPSGIIEMYMRLADIRKQLAALAPILRNYDRLEELSGSQEEQVQEDLRLLTSYRRRGDVPDGTPGHRKTAQVPGSGCLVPVAKKSTPRTVERHLCFRVGPSFEE